MNILVNCFMFLQDKQYAHIDIGKQDYSGKFTFTICLKNQFQIEELVTYLMNGITEKTDKQWNKILSLNANTKIDGFTCKNIYAYIIKI